MFLPRLLFGVTAIIALTTTAALSKPKPKGAKPTDSQVVANHYVGTTRNWQFCDMKGGIYFGGNWSATVYCPTNGGEFIGIGTWSVKRGTLCREVTNYWIKDGKRQSRHRKDPKDCINHVTDKDGRIWRNFSADNEWNLMPSIENDKRAVKGDKYKAKFNRLKKQMKL